MVLVIYDSNYGNTGMIAEAVTSVFEDAKCLSVENAAGADLNCQLLIVGSPINAWRATSKLTNFLSNLKPDQLNGVRAAAFDTRFDSIFSGNAAKKIAKSLNNAGAQLISSPQGFYVTAKEGPLVAGEIEKAKNWATSLKQML